jgi:mRNA degradation ribonuclease J1/J2
LGEFNKSQLGRIQQIATWANSTNRYFGPIQQLGRIQQIATWANSTNRNLGEFNKFHDFFSIVEFGHQGD